ncbi:MAG: multicopper oxidase family protein [Micromonosporaceae bacterium]|nr:multicopper oxidase family protein [Micromonosporaceae bacterium]
MSTLSLMAVDLLVALVSAGTWLGAAIAAASGRARAGRILAVSAVAVTLVRVAVVVALAGRGWWFVQEKVVFALPLVILAGAVAVVVLVTRGITAAVVPLYGAGFAAGVGVLSPLLTGYPMGVGQALTSLCVAAVATLVAWRLTSGAAAPTRRLLVPVIVLGLVGVGLELLPASSAADGPIRTTVSELRGPSTPAPGGSVRRVELAARKASVTLASGATVEAWTYNASAPGPEITALEGDLLEVTLTNVDIESGVTLHWHGYDVPNAEDGAPGVTQAAVPPGGSHVYRFLANQVGTYWYHTHQVSSEGVRRGLFGALVVRPRGDVSDTEIDTDSERERETIDLTLPVHTYDGIVALGVHDDVHQMSVAPGTPVRLRLINTDSTPHRLSLAGTEFRVVAVDGYDLHEPGRVSNQALRLPAGGRADLSFPMPAGAVALLVDDDPSRATLRINGDPASTVDTAATVDTIGWPELDLRAYGTPAPTPFGPDSAFDRDFTLVLDRGLALVDGVPMFAQTVNGLGYPNIPDQRVREGDLVRVTVVNRSIETHPWHLHGHRVLVLGTTGSPLWLDTFDVRPGEVWRVAFRADNPGIWMNHCHNLDHANQGMVLHLSYEGVASYDGAGTSHVGH